MKSIRILTIIFTALFVFSCNSDIETEDVQIVEPELKPAIPEVYKIFSKAIKEKDNINLLMKDASRDKNDELIKELGIKFSELRNNTVKSIDSILGGEENGIEIPFDQIDYKDIFEAGTLKVTDINWIDFDIITLHFILEIKALNDIPAKPFKFVFTDVDGNNSKEQRFYLAADIEILKAGETGILHSNPKVNEINNIAKLLIEKQKDSN